MDLASRKLRRNLHSVYLVPTYLLGNEDAGELSLPSCSACETILACAFTANSEHPVPSYWLGDGGDVDAVVRQHVGVLPGNKACPASQRV